MATQECGNCSAPLELGPVGTVVRCGYCGTDNRIRPVGGQPARPVPTGSGRPPAAPFNPLVLAILGGVLMLGSVIAGFAFFSSGAITGPHAGLADTRVSPNVLATTEERFLELDPPPGLEGTLTSFPIVGNDAWVLGIAHAWKPDARFRSLSADEVELETATATEVTYQFISPSSVADYRARAETEDPEVNYGLVILVQDGKLKATRLMGRPDDDPPPERFDACTPKEALDAALERGNLPRRPRYRVYGGFDRQNRPFWQINTIGGDTSASVGANCAMR